MKPIIRILPLILRRQEIHDDLTGFFDLSNEPRRFRVIDATKNAAFFLNDKRPPTDPDDDGSPAP